MDSIITLAIARTAGRGTKRRQREILGHIPNPRRAVYVDEQGADTLIVSVGRETIMASGVDLYEAAQELANIHGLPVRMLDNDSREMWRVSASELIS